LCCFFSKDGLQTYADILLEKHLLSAFANFSGHKCNVFFSAAIHQLPAIKSEKLGTINDPLTIESKIVL